MTSCMPPVSSKNRSSTSASCGRHRAEHRAADGEVVDDHRRPASASMPVRLDQPRARAVGVAARRGTRRRARAARDTSSDSSAVRAGASPRPERDGGRRVAGVAHAHDAGFDPPDLPRVRAEQEDVARHRLDGPVLVDGADEGVVGLGDDAVVADLGDRAARRDRGEPRALAAAHLAVDRVVVHVAAARAAAGLRCRRPTSVDHLVELLARSSSVYGRGAAHQRDRGRRSRHSCAPTSATICWARMSSGRRGQLDRVEPAGAHRARAARRTRRARRASAGTAAPSACRRGCGSSGRRAAGTWRCCAASRSGTPARPGRCRCRARATRWRRAP